MFQVFLFASISLTLSASGCASRYKGATADFRATIDDASKAVGVYFLEMNSFEREVYLEGVLVDPKLPILFTDSEGQMTGLSGGVFSRESIQARMDSIRLLGRYAELLAKLADSDAPTNFKSGADALGKNLSGLSSKFEKLIGSDPSASKYVGPLASLIGSIGEMILAAQRDAAIREGVEKGAPHVRTILKLLKEDCELAIEPLQATGLKEILADKIKFYNDSRSTLSYDQRQARIREVKLVAERYDALVEADPSSLVDSMADAHEALVAYVLDSDDDQKQIQVIQKAEALRAATASELSAVKKLDAAKGER